MRSLKQIQKEKILTEYTCGYCGNIFQQYIGTHYGEGDPQTKKSKNNTSSQVVCKRCGNFLKTKGGKIVK